MADIEANVENKTAGELLGEGIRAYIIMHYDEAISLLSKACELMVAEHQSQMHPSLGKAYLYYGKALLEQARVQAEPLGDGVPKNAEDESEDEEEDLEPEENGESSENKPEHGGDDETPKDTENESKEDAKPEEKVESSTEQPEDKPGPSGEGEAKMEVDLPADQEDAASDGETNDLQLAWEVLELAKKIFLAQGEDGRKNLADTLIALAEVSLENGNFEPAIGDMLEGLRVQRLIFGKDSRTIAETCFKLGVAYSMNMKIDDAVKSFNDSLQCLKTRIGKLELQQDKTDEVTEEIKEIRLFVPDIVEKIAEMKSYKDEMLQKLISTATSRGSGETSSPSPSSSSPSSSKPANNITHLVKRKRKLDTIAEETPDHSDAKKSKNGNN